LLPEVAVTFNVKILKFLEADSHHYQQRMTLLDLRPTWATYFESMDLFFVFPFLVVLLLTKQVFHKDQLPLLVMLLPVLFMMVIVTSFQAFLEEPLTVIA